MRRAATAGGRGAAAWLAIPLFLVIYAALVLLWHPPAWFAGIHAGASLVTFIVYGADKEAARSGAWRVREGNLHMLALLGGWPGALVAQRVLRHKSAKEAFLRVFWTTVVLNVAGFAWLCSPAGRALWAGG